MNEFDWEAFNRYVEDVIDHLDDENYHYKYRTLSSFKKKKSIFPNSS